MADTGRSTHNRAETRRHLEGYLEAYPGLRGRVCRILLLHLHSKGYVRIEDVYRRAQRAEEGWNSPTDPNRPSSRLWAADEKEIINGIVIDLAAEFLAPRQVDDIVWAAHRRDEAQSLETLARMPGVPIELVAEKVSQFATLPIAEKDRLGADAPEGTKVALIRRFISDRVDYIRIAKRNLRIKDLDWILQRSVGTERGQGLIGGKAAGMVLAGAILAQDEEEYVRLPETVFVLTDCYDEFKEINGLEHLGDHKYKAIRDVRSDFRAIGEIFRNAEFPPRVADLLRVELSRWGEVPLIVRSSSVLEDNFSATFSGIYASLFLLNQGRLEDRLRELVAAICEIYSGVFSPDAVSYRRAHDLLDYDERMGIMIQPVIGSRYDDIYLPAMAGVAFSRNDYRWNKRIRRDDGIARMVLGLGTHAVDRVGDYARMVPLMMPTMRPEGTPGEIIRASQKHVDVVDLKGGGFMNVPVGKVLEKMRPAGLADYVSIIGQGRLSQPVGSMVGEPVDELCVTFDRLLARGDFTKRMSGMLKQLEKAYRVPVDMEFAIDHGRFYVLQCRPLGGEMSPAGAPVPKDVAAEDRIFSAAKYVSNGLLEGIEYVVLVDPTAYGDLESRERQIEVARAVGHINDALAERKFILLGPGRWGSRDIRLGVQVSYADIAHAAALVEISQAAGGTFSAEPSFGTHFFQDLIEASILYLPLYPGEEGVVFNEPFLLETPNALAGLRPDHAAMADVVRVIDVAAAAPGRTLNLAMDGEAQEALCYLR